MEVQQRCSVEEWYSYLKLKSVWTDCGECGSSGGAQLSGRKLIKSNQFCQIETEIVGWS